MTKRQLAAFAAELAARRSSTRSGSARCPDIRGRDARLLGCDSARRTPSEPARAAADIRRSPPTSITDHRRRGIEPQVGTAEFVAKVSPTPIEGRWRRTTSIGRSTVATGLALGDSRQNPRSSDTDEGDGGDAVTRATR